MESHYFEIGLMLPSQKHNQERLDRGKKIYEGGEKKGVGHFDGDLGQGYDQGFR